jgi:hypothetical protein
MGYSRTRLEVLCEKRQHREIRLGLRSGDDGIFEGRGRTLILTPFDSDCAPFDPNVAANNYKEFALMARKFGHKIIASTLIDCGKPN